MVDYIATTCITQNIDACDKNHFAYRDTNGSGEWTMLPWDLDLTFGPNQLNTDTIVYNQNYASHPFIGARPYILIPVKYNRFLEAIINTPRGREMVLRRIRSLSDQFLSTHWFQNRIDQLVPQLDADVTLYHARWGSSSNFGGVTHTLLAATNRIKNEYLSPRTTWLNYGGSVGIPASQDVAPQITFGSYEANPPGNNQDQEYIQLNNPNAFAVDVSNWTIAGGVTHTIRSGTVIPAGSALHLTPGVSAFRARTTGPGAGRGLFVQGNISGHLSNFGETLTLKNPQGTTVSTIVIPPDPSDQQRFLAITELMYKPAPDGNAEFIELMNTSPAVTLDLAGVRFSSGIDFTFPAGVTLAPLARILIVKDIATFEAVHGTDKPVASVFENGTSLNNGGERVKLDDVTGCSICDFTYDNIAPWPIQASGNANHVLIAPLTHPDPGLPQNWRASMTATGNPGADDAVHFIGTANADDDGDGWANLIEYAFGPNPIFAAAHLPEGLTLTAPGIINADDAVAGAEVSTDLQTWIPAEVISDSGGTLTFRAPPAMLAEPRLFIRAVARLR